jgi:CMP-N-acetylneuraminic acid synthetase
MSVSPFTHTPFAALSLDPKGILRPYFPEYIGKKSQEMPLAFRPNGAIHILNIPAFKLTRDYFSPPLVGYVMPRERSVDIDTEDDLREAESVLGIARK